MRRVQDIWYQDSDGKERKLRLVNHDVDVREGHRLELVYTSNGPLEYIRNLTLDETTPLYNYVYDYHGLNTSQEISGTIYFSILFGIPVIGALMSFFSITTGYSYLNRPIRRSYLGRSVLLWSIFAALASIYITFSVVGGIMSGTATIGSIITEMVVVMFAIAATRIWAMHIVKERAKQMESRLYALLEKL